MFTRLRLVLVLALASTALIALAAHADASCAVAPSVSAALQQGDTIFVGTVTSTENRGRTATFLVKEIWRGPNVTPLVKVHGAPDDRTITTSADRTYESGVEYLVVARRDGDMLRDDACSATQPWADGLAAFRPADARAPVDERPTSGPPGGASYAWVFLLILVGGTLAAGLMLRRR
jgi:hypothetical protein